MIASILSKLMAAGDWWVKTVDYEIIKGNPIWRFTLVLLVILVAMVAGRVVQFAINTYTSKRERKSGVTVLTLFLKCSSNPVYVAFFALGLYICRLCLVFEDTTVTPVVEGISGTIEQGWTQVSKAVAAVAVAYSIFKSVDIVEYYLLRWTGKTETQTLYLKKEQDSND